MRKAKLSIEKHFLPSCECLVAKHNAEIIFSLHDELTDAIRAIYVCSKKNVFVRQKLMEKIIYCRSKIESDIAESVDVGGATLPMHRLLRTSALDRLLKVAKEADLLINTNPL
jgi:hypothetical protein